MKQQARSTLKTASREVNTVHCLIVEVTTFCSSSFLLAFYLVCDCGCVSQVDKGEEDLRQLERKLKQAASECECLDEHNNYLNGELDR